MRTCSHWSFVLSKLNHWLYSNYVKSNVKCSRCDPKVVTNVQKGNILMMAFLVQTELTTLCQGCRPDPKLATTEKSSFLSPTELTTLCQGRRPGSKVVTTEKSSEPRHVISNILTSVDSDEPVQPPFKLRNSKCCSASS